MLLLGYSWDDTSRTPSRLMMMPARRSLSSVKGSPLLSSCSPNRSTKGQVTAHFLTLPERHPLPRHNVFFISEIPRSIINRARLRVQQRDRLNSKVGSDHIDPKNFTACLFTVFLKRERKEHHNGGENATTVAVHRLTSVGRPHPNPQSRASTYQSSVTPTGVLALPSRSAKPTL